MSKRGISPATDNLLLLLSVYTVKMPDGWLPENGGKAEIGEGEKTVGGGYRK